MRDRVGSLIWAETTWGGLRPSDYLALVGQAALTLLRELPPYVGRRFELSVPFRTRLDLNHVPVPNTPASRESEAISASVMPCFLLSHSFRTYVWATAMASDDAIEYDEEVLYVSCLLHDIGLAKKSPPSASSICFTLLGQQQARRIAVSAGWTEERRRAVEEAITLHMNPRVRRIESPEGHLLSRASRFDVLGFGRSSIDPQTIGEVTHRFPRYSAKERFVELFNATNHHPLSRARFYGRLGFRWCIRIGPWSE